MKRRPSPIAAALVAIALLVVVVAALCTPSDPTRSVEGVAPHDASADHKLGAYQPWGTGAAAPAGTGIAHVSAGAFVSPATAVGLSSSDVTGTLGVGNGGTGVATMGASACIPHSAGGTTALTCSSIVDVDVAAGAAIASSKLGAPGSNTQVMWNNAGTPGADANFTYASGVASLGTAVSIGNTPATIGNTRHANATNMCAYRNAANTADIVALASDASNVLYVGSDASLAHATTNLVATTSSGTAIQTNGSSLNVGSNASFTNAHSATNVVASTAVGLDIGGTTYFYVNSATGANEAWKPIIGSAGGSSPWSTHGDSTVSITGSATYTVTAAIYAYEENIYTGAQAGGVTITYPRPAVGSAFHKWIVKNTTGANTPFTISVGTATTCAMTSADGTSLWVMFDNAGCHIMAPQQTY